MKRKIISLLVTCVCTWPVHDDIWGIFRYLFSKWYRKIRGRMGVYEYLLYGCS